MISQTQTQTQNSDFISFLIKVDSMLNEKLIQMRKRNLIDNITNNKDSKALLNALKLNFGGN